MPHQASKRRSAQLDRGGVRTAEDVTRFYGRSYVNPSTWIFSDPRGPGREKRECVEALDAAEQTFCRTDGVSWCHVLDFNDYLWPFMYFLSLYVVQRS